MEKELPKLDVPDDFIVGTGIPESILNLYKNYPCRLKAAVFILCTKGQIEGTVNLNRHVVRKNDFVILSPGSILQLHRAEDDPQFYVMVFSSHFLAEANLPKPVLNFLYTIKSVPLIHLPAEYAELYEGFFKLLIRANELNPDQTPEVTKGIMLAILYRIKELYRQQDQVTQERPATRNEQICKDFGHLVIQHYTHERSIAFYAKKLGITPTHLSNTVKQGTGRTVIQIISALVINDAKAQLKSTDLPINEIAESLNFANVSFFGKYFKRHVGMGPQAYRNS